MRRRLSRGRAANTLARGDDLGARFEARRGGGDFSLVEQLVESSISASPFIETTANKQTAPLSQGVEGQEGFSNLSRGSLAE